MSLELGQPADGDQAMSADEAEETRPLEGTVIPAQPAASGATTAYADSGVPDPDDSDAADAPGATEPHDADESPGASDLSDDAEDTDAADAPDTQETRDVWDTPSASGAADETDVPETVDAWDASEDPDATETPDTPDTPETADAHEAADAEPAIDPGASGTAEPSVLDDATGGPVVNGATDAMGAPVAASSPAEEEEGIPVPESGASQAPAASGAQLEEAAGDLDGPLLGDVAALRANWQQIVAGFVDDPTEAVADAADLVERTTQALVGALQARQRLLRARWESDRSPDDLGASSTGSARGAHAAEGSRADSALDTEELRLLIQRYRTLFNDICRS
jgi:hypothetical protein